MLPTDLSLLKDSHDLFTTSKTSDSSDSKIDSKAIGRWTKEEHQRFVDGLKKFGKNWKLIEDYVETRTGSQIRSHAQKYFIKMGKDFNFDPIEPEIPSQIQKKEVPEPMRKESDGSNSTSYSNQGAAVEMPATESIRLPKPLEPLNSKNLGLDSLKRALGVEIPVSTTPLRNSSYIPVNPTRLDDLIALNTATARSRKMSLDDYPPKPYVNPLLEAFLSKIKPSENGLQLPSLSELVDLGARNRQRAMSNYVETPLLSTNIMSSFGLQNPTPRIPNPRKFSEDNILIQNRLGQAPQNNNNPNNNNNNNNNWPDLETITKKIKKL
jgi:SHAQKYF class myb-like DNA-binding protein